MSQEEIYRRQFEAAALHGLLSRRMGITIDLPFEVVPALEDDPVPSAVSTTLNDLMQEGLCYRYGLCTSIRESNHSGIIRRYVLDNRRAAEVRLQELKRSLGRLYAEPTPQQMKHSRPRDLHLPVRTFSNALFT